MNQEEFEDLVWCNMLEIEEKIREKRKEKEEDKEKDKESDNKKRKKEDEEIESDVGSDKEDDEFGEFSHPLLRSAPKKNSAFIMFCDDEFIGYLSKRGLYAYIRHLKTKRADLTLLRFHQL